MQSIYVIDPIIEKLISSMTINQLVHTNVQLTGVYSQFLRYFIHQSQILPDRFQTGNDVVEIRQRDGVRVFGQLFGDNFAAGLQNIVERNFQLLGIGLEQIVDLLFRGSQVELDVL